MSELAARLGPEAAYGDERRVERYNSATQAVILLETDSGFRLLILGPLGWDYVGGLEFGPVV